MPARPRGEYADLDAVRARQAGASREVAGDQAVVHGVVERLAEDGVHPVDGARRELGLLRVDEALDLIGRERVQAGRAERRREVALDEHRVEGVRARADWCGGDPALEVILDPLGTRAGPHVGAMLGACLIRLRPGRVLRRTGEGALLAADRDAQLLLTVALAPGALVLATFGVSGLIGRFLASRRHRCLSNPAAGSATVPACPN